LVWSSCFFLKAKELLHLLFSFQRNLAKAVVGSGVCTRLPLRSYSLYASFSCTTLVEVSAAPTAAAGAASFPLVLAAVDWRDLAGGGAAAEAAEVPLGAALPLGCTLVTLGGMMAMG
jgi:hypothetical protein